MFGQITAFIFDTIENVEEVDWQEDIFECDDSNEEDMLPLARLVCQK